MTTYRNAINTINRNTLVGAINKASKTLDYDTYKELLKIYYKLLEQEEINDEFINEFTVYNDISESASQLLLNAGLAYAY